ncbi:MAG: CRISPR-associated ring nuclease [Desulfamplus sp.]
MTNILVTTLGGSWQILPELMGFTNPALVDIFKYHPRIERIEQERKKHGITPVDELWMVTTYGEQTNKSLKTAMEWYKELATNTRPTLRIWQVDDTNNLATEEECQRMYEAIHTIVFHARHCSKNGKLFLSLTGGRKTMSTDLQNAATWFGCEAMIHVVDNPSSLGGVKPSELNVKDFLTPLKAEYGDLFTPFIVGKYAVNPILSIAKSGNGALSGGVNRYPVPYTSAVESVNLSVDSSFPLITTLEKLQADAGYLICNYTNTMLQGESQTNFLALYSLPEQKIEELKRWRMGIEPEKEEAELSFLKKLPKAELHCHLGGVANADELIRIASAASDDIKSYANLLKSWDKNIKLLITLRDVEKIKEHIVSLKDVGKPAQLSGKVPSCICTASFILLFKNDPELLEQVIYGQYINESQFCSIGFPSYVQLGDLQGTGLLKHPSCLEEACRVIADEAIEHNVLYLELRCSPVNYESEHMSKYRVYEIIRDTLSEYKEKHDLNSSVIFIASRHGDMKSAERHVELACEILSKEGEASNEKVGLRGFDLAGDESACKPPEMQPCLMPVMERCLHFTIHAGENQPVRSIWEAVYHLNAERIGHCLTLNENPELMERFLDRNIVLEMCPSSNFQIIGYRDNYYENTKSLKIYPLKEYFDKGLRVTVNTDNPGISRTDFSKELHRACRLSPGGLSMWEILSIIRNSFKATFAPRHVRHSILRKAEESIVRLLQQET